MDTCRLSATAAAPTGFSSDTWVALDRVAATKPARFDPSTLVDLPDPAQRLLAAAIPDHAPLHDIVRLSMQGEIRLAGRWLPFTARQILRAATGFVWVPEVGGRFVRFVGADALGPGGARIEFRLHGRIPIVRGSGPDVARSAAGRLAAETVAWLPQALTPQSGARWSALDDERATVTLDGPAGPTDVELAVDDAGRITELGLLRWKDSARPPGPVAFGGTVDSTVSTPGGVAIAGGGTVGWEWGTAAEADGRFFRYRITSAEFGPSGTVRRPGGRPASNGEGIAGG